MAETTEMKVRSVSRALDCLKYLAERPDGAALAVIARELHIPKTTAYYILETLTSEGFLTRDVHGSYHLGVQAFRVGSAYSSQLRITAQFHRVAREVVNKTGETVQLGVLDGRRIVYIAKEESIHPVRLVSEVGSTLPAHITALGKVLLAGIDEKELAVLFPPTLELERLTEHSITSTDVLFEELETVRKRGYALDLEETSLGLLCFAAPVIGADGNMVAAMSVSAPSNRVDSDHRATLIMTIIDAAANLSYLMGGQPVVAKVAAA